MYGGCVTANGKVIVTNSVIIDEVDITENISFY